MRVCWYVDEWCVWDLFSITMTTIAMMMTMVMTMAMMVTTMMSLTMMINNIGVYGFTYFKS